MPCGVQSPVSRSLSVVLFNIEVQGKAVQMTSCTNFKFSCAGCILNYVKRHSNWEELLSHKKYPGLSGTAKIRKKMANPIEKRTAKYRKKQFAEVIQVTSKHRSSTQLHQMQRKLGEKHWVLGLDLQWFRQWPFFGSCVGPWAWMIQGTGGGSHHFGIQYGGIILNSEGTMSRPFP